jgi:dTDP-4-dehydrorhamnose reductase
MKILLLGKDGQVGWSLQRTLAPLGTLQMLDVGDCDFTNPDALRSAVEAARADVIVNAAAYTAVDKAESDARVAQLVNATAPGVMAGVAHRTRALLIHYSTDYVFDGAKSGAYVETDAPAPLNVYGASKLAGENAIRDSGCQYLTFRTSWVFSAHGANFIKTMLRLARERDGLTVIDDQIGAPTSAELLADVTALCLHQWKTQPERRAALCGLYHLVAAGETSWYGFAKHVIEYARARGVPITVAPDAIRPIPTSAYPTAAKRPLNSRLDTAKIRSTFGLTLPDWKVHATRTLVELLRSPA